MPKRSRHSPPPAHHVTGRYRRDLPPPDQRGRPGERVRQPGRCLLLGLLVTVGSAALTALLALALVWLWRAGKPAGRNAIWLGIDWGETVHGDEVVRNLAEGLRRYQIGTVYLWTSWLQEDGTWSETTFDSIGAFVGQFKRAYPEARLYAWIGLPAELPEYRLDDAELRADVAAFSARTITNFGFDGVHLNAEPVWDGDNDFVALLREVRGVIGPDVPLSVAVPPDWNTGTPGVPVGPYTTPDAMWSLEYKQQIAFLADEIVVMAYNSGLSLPQDYETWMAFQVTQFTSAIAPLEVDTHLIFGIPTYDAEPPGHDPAVESVPAAIAGIKRGLAQSGEAAALVQGIGLYAYWSTEAPEWAAYRQLWLDQAAD